MEIRFDTQVAQALSVHEAIFLGWLQHSYTQKPIKTAELEDIFGFWKDEVVYKVLLRLEERQILQIRRDVEDYCIFSIHVEAYVAQTGQQPETSLPSCEPILDDNLKKHLKRFQSTDSLLNKKLTQLIHDHTDALLDYAKQEGLSHDLASTTLDKFLHYVAANPDRFWNQDLVAYWRFWVSNTKDKTQPQQAGNGKRAAIERSVQSAADNWLKKKAQDPQLYQSVKITHE